MEIIKLFLIFGGIAASVMASPSNSNVQGFTGIISRNGDNYNMQGILNTGYMSGVTKGKNSAGNINVQGIINHGYTDRVSSAKASPRNINVQGIVNTGVFRQGAK